MHSNWYLGEARRGGGAPVVGSGCTPSRIAFRVSPRATHAETRSERELREACWLRCRTARCTHMFLHITPTRPQRESTIDNKRQVQTKPPRPSSSVNILPLPPPSQRNIHIRDPIMSQLSTAPESAPIDCACTRHLGPKLLTHFLTRLLVHCSPVSSDIDRVQC